jgi:hypothetical protein
MIHFKTLALGACLFGFLLTSSAAAAEPRTLPTPRRLELERPFSRTSALPFGLRLPQFLSQNGGSVPATNAHVITHGPRPTECRSHCAEGPVTDRARATTSAVLAGVGGLAVVTGVVLSISLPRRFEGSGLSPTFQVKLSGQRAVAGANWRF